MKRNLTIEELTRVHALGEKAERISKVTEEKNLDFIFDFSFGIHEACAHVRLSCADIGKPIVDYITLHLFDEGEYEEIDKALDLALKAVGNDCVKEQIAYYEGKIAELKAKHDA